MKHPAEQDPYFSVKLSLARTVFEKGNASIETLKRVFQEEFGELPSPEFIAYLKDRLLPEMRAQTDADPAGDFQSVPTGLYGESRGETAKKQKSIRVLVVDDDAEKAARFMLRLSKLPDRSLKVHQTLGPDDGLSMADGREPDVVFLSLGLKGMKGAKALAAIRRVLPMSAVVALTDPETREMAEEAMANGAQDWLDRNDPDSGVLSRALKRAFDRRQAGKAVQNALLKERQVREELRRALQDLEDAHLGRMELLSRFSREIRTPLTSVIGFTDLLLESDLSPAQSEYAATIKKSGRAILSFVMDMLDFSRIESGELDLDAVDFEPESLVQEVMETIRPRLTGKNVTLEQEVADAVPQELIGDAVRIRQVLVNLMGNAVRYADEGRVLLRLILDGEDEDHVNLHFIVEDTGPGIGKDALAEIFSPRGKATAATISPDGYADLGLPVCKHIAYLMGGDLFAESEPGQGSQFHFTARLDKVEKDDERSRAPASLEGRKVLVVDDVESHQERLVSMIKRAGMRAVGLHSGIEAVPTLQRALEADNPLEAVICAARMHGMSGPDVARQIRLFEDRLGRIPLLAFASTPETDAPRCREAGFDVVLKKPVRRADLWSALEGLFEGGKRDGEKEEKKAVILLAEDDPHSRKLVNYMLEKAGHKVHAVEDGQEAVRMVEANPEKFDLVFMDVQMPRLDGLAATQYLRERGFHKLPIVAMTASAMAEDKRVCLDAGMNDYVSKPVNRTSLEAILKKWIFNSR